jgi:hypothetical protein
MLSISQTNLLYSPLSHTHKHWQLLELASGNDHPQYQLRCGVSARTATFSYAAGVFSATYVSDYDVWTNGVRWPITTTRTVALASNNTLYYIYFDTDGVMKATTTEWDLLANTAPFALVFRVSAALAAMGDERHRQDRNRGLHSWAHESIGCRYDTLHGGLTGTFGATTFSITAGTVWDEDLKQDIVGVQTTCRRWSRIAGATSVEFVDGATVLYSLNGANIQYDNAGTLTDATGNRYVCHYVFATNDITVPIYSLIGQAQHVLLSDAQNEAVPAFAGLTTVEWKLLYKVIYRNTGSPPTYVSALDYRNVIGVPTTFAPTAHGGLTGLEADDHTQYRLESEDHTHQSAGLQAGQLDHGLSMVAASLLDDDHTQYVLRSLFTEQGDIAYRNATIWAALAHGTAGQVLITGGDAANPSWSSAPTITFANANHTHQAAGTGGQLDHGLAIVAASLLDDDHTQYVLHTDVDDTPVDGETDDPISSNWAYDHVAAADPHTGYQKESEKGAASGYASLDAGTKVPTVELGGAGADNTKYLRGDQTWVAPASGGDMLKATYDTDDNGILNEASIPISIGLVWAIVFGG